MIEVIGKVVDALLQAIGSSIRAGKSIREALALGLEETAANIRAGKLNIDGALDRAESDQKMIDSTRDRFKD